MFLLLGFLQYSEPILRILLALLALATQLSSTKEDNYSLWQISMAISWDNIGRMANVAQLVGTDPISLVNAVITNVSDARTHRKVCKRFLMQLEVIRNLLELLNMSELNNYPWRLRRPLAQLEGTLQRSFDLVNSCKNHNYLYLLLLGRSIARQFKRAQSEIEMHLISIIPLIILMDNQRLREALSSSDENQNENMDEGSREMHDGNTSVSQTNPSSGEVHRTEEETLNCTEDNQNGNSLGEEIREVHDGIPDSVVVNPNENDLIEEIMEMHNGNTLASEDSSFSQVVLQTKNKEILYGTNGNRSKSILDEEIREKQDGSTSGSYKNLFSREFHQTEKKVPRRKFQRLHTKVFGFWRIKNRNCGTANQLLMANNRIMELGISDAFLRIFTVQELEEAMNNFRYENPIAEESSGKMYLGSVRNNSSNPADGGSKTDVAIKIWKSTPSSEFLNWRNEVNTLGRMLHPNIIKLLGCCMEDEKLFTVYEFMEHGTLYDRLFGRAKAQPLSWELRIKIAIGVARGIAFLHMSEKKIIHRNVKPSAILLDSNFNAKLSSLEFSTFEPTDGEAKTMVGTIGYMPPEVLEGTITVKIDVYAFGITLLEMLSGKKAIDVKTREAAELREFAMPYLSDHGKLANLMDPTLQGCYPFKAALEVAQLTLRCIDDDPDNRPSMDEILKTLEKIETVAYRNEDKTTLHQLRTVGDDYVAETMAHTSEEVGTTLEHMLTVDDDDDGGFNDDDDDGGFNDDDDDGGGVNDDDDDELCGR